MTFDDIETQAIHSVARVDFYFFVRWMFLKMRGQKWLRGAHHVIVCEALERVARGKIKRLIINIPPRYSKTELAVIHFIAWCFGRNPSCKFIHTSYGASLAEENAYSIRELMESEEYKKIFPYVHLSTEKISNFKTTAGGALRTAGSMGALTGFGAGGMGDEFGGAIVIDDPYKPDEALSDTTRRKVIRWFQGTLESRLNNTKTTPIILIMQRLHEGDLSGWLADGGNGEDWEVVSLPAITAEGEALWPERHTLDDLRKMEKYNPYFFASQYMQRPAPLEGGLFKAGKMETVEAGAVLRRVRAWDLASTLDGDYTVGLLLGETEGGRYVVLDVVRGRLDSDKRDALILNTARMDGAGVSISIPQDPGQAGKSQVGYLSKMLTGFIVTFTPESGDKVTRAMPVSSQVNAGNMDIVRGNWNMAFVDELNAFPNAMHDDQVDALSRAFNFFVAEGGGFNIA